MYTLWLYFRNIFAHFDCSFCFFEHKQNVLHLFNWQLCYKYFLATLGLAVGDEILVINGRVVTELDMVYIENVLQETKTISLTLRSCQSDSLLPFSDRMVFHSYEIENLMCPPPPTQMPVTDENIGNLIVPAPNLGTCTFAVQDCLWFLMVIIFV